MRFECREPRFRARIRAGATDEARGVSQRLLNRAIVIAAMVSSASEATLTRRARPSGHCPGRRARSALGSPHGSPSGWLQRTRRAAACVRPPEARESLSRERSGRQPVATLAPAGGDDPATGTGAHPKTEPVRLGPSPVVRLERPLAHRKTPSKGGKGTLAPPTHRRPVEPTVARPAGQTRPDRR